MRADGLMVPLISRARGARAGRYSAESIACSRTVMTLFGSSAARYTVPPLEPLIRLKPLLVCSGGRFEASQEIPTL